MLHNRNRSASVKYIVDQGDNQLFTSEGALFMKFHSITPTCLFNRDTTFSQTVIDKVLRDVF